MPRGPAAAHTTVMQLSVLLLLSGALPSRALLHNSPCLHALRVSYAARSTICSAKLPRVRVVDIKRQLTAAGVDCTGIVEKEELVRMLNALPPSTAPVPGPQSSLELSISFMQGGAYANFDATEGRALQLLIDSGAAVSIVSGDQFAPAGTRVTLRSRTCVGLSIECSVASAAQALPPGVDGILGVDVMRTYGTAEFDWDARILRLHKGGHAPPGMGGASFPMEMRQVGAGTLPFVRARFGGCDVDSLVDTGSPVTMVTPELGMAAQMQPSADASADIITTGVDGQPTRMRASRVDSIGLGDVAAWHGPSVVYVGLCPMMAMVGWQNSRAALLGLDVLRLPPATATPENDQGVAGPIPSGRLILEFERGLLRIAS